MKVEVQLADKEHLHTHLHLKIKLLLLTKSTELYCEDIDTRTKVNKECPKFEIRKKPPTIEPYHHANNKVVALKLHFINIHVTVKTHFTFQNPENQNSSIFLKIYSIHNKRILIQKSYQQIPRMD